MWIEGPKQSQISNRWVVRMRHVGLGPSEKEEEVVVGNLEHQGRGFAFGMALTECGWTIVLCTEFFVPTSVD